MGGLHWLQGKSWWEVSRDERFFCAELYQRIRGDVTRFVAYLSREIDLDPRGHWQAAYPVCLQSDLWQPRSRSDADRRDTARPPVERSSGIERVRFERSSNLALLSDHDVVLIEVAGEHGLQLESVQQLNRAAADLKDLLPQLRDVYCAALVSSQTEPPREVVRALGGPLLRWKALSELYGDDELLLRADTLFEGIGLGSAVFADDVLSGDWGASEYAGPDTEQPPGGQHWFAVEEALPSVWPLTNLRQK
ncbi:MAG: hypothetical protein RL685_2097 [Pseudomonadota bacterium]|jgi:hypothetical protein